MLEAPAYSEIRDSWPDQYHEEGASCKVENFPSDKLSTADVEKDRMFPAEESFLENVEPPIGISTHLTRGF